MNRTELQWLANERIAESEILLAAEKWSGAYYLGGYAVECALKACICKLTKVDEFPDKDFAASCWSHKLEPLLELAGLAKALAADFGGDPKHPLRLNWKTVSQWNEKRRYEAISKGWAEELVAAITDQENGMLTWLKRRW